MRKLFPVFVVWVMIFSCKGEDTVPAGILPKEKMQEVLWSVLSAGEFLNGYVLTKDSVDKILEGSKLYGQVFQVHKVTREEFEKSFAYYQHHPELMKVILDSLSRKQSYTPGTFQRREDSMRKRPLRDSLIKTAVE